MADTSHDNPDAKSYEAHTTAGFDRFAHFVIQRTPAGELDMLGGGGMGITYRAFDTQLERTVALKLINPQRVLDPEIRSRFSREARAAGRLLHPNIASVLYQGDEGPNCFYVMELVAGEDLHHYIERIGPLGPVHALRIAHQVAGAITAAWEQNILHRDLKPGNIMLTTYMEGGPTHVKVIDFGLAKLVTDQPSTFVTGGFLGTPEFASPEQCEEKELDVRSDLYSLGVTLWFMLTGSPPYTGSLIGIVTSQISAEIPFDQLPHAPEPLKRVLSRLLAKDPDERPGSPLEAAREIEEAIEELREDLTNFEPLSRSGEPPPKRTQRLIRAGSTVPMTQVAPPSRTGRNMAIAAGVLLLAGGGALALMKPWARPAIATSTANTANAVAAATPAPPAADSTPSPETASLPEPTEESNVEVGETSSLLDHFAMTSPGSAPAWTLQPDTPLPQPEPLVEESPAPTPAESPEPTPTPEAVALAAAPKPPAQPLSAATPPPAAPQPQRQQFINSLGMRFVYLPVAGIDVCVWETRVRDFQAFTRATGYRPSVSGSRSWQSPGFMQSPEHPVVYVSFVDARKFCEWLTAKELKEGRLKPGESYRLPHRPEWDEAAGAAPGGGRRQGGPQAGGGMDFSATSSGSQYLRVANDDFPGQGSMGADDWMYDGGSAGGSAGGGQEGGGRRPPQKTLLWGERIWPPPERTVNAADKTAYNQRYLTKWIEGYEDGAATTATVGSFPQNKVGVFDTAGNVWEICTDGPPELARGAKQGGSWRSFEQKDFMSNTIVNIKNTDREQDMGFRCVLERNRTAQ